MLALTPAPLAAQTQNEALDALFDAHEITSDEFAQMLSGFSRRLSDKALSHITQNPQETFPAIGDGDQTLIEFSDYRCGFCRRQFPAIHAAIADGDIRLIVIEFPILGDLSLTAARLALLAARHDKFAEFHQRAMQADALTESALSEIADDLALPAADADSDAITAQLEHNFLLASLLGVSSTPTMFLNRQRITGFVQQDDFQSLIKNAK